MDRIFIVRLQGDETGIERFVSELPKLAERGALGLRVSEQSG